MSLDYVLGCFLGNERLWSASFTMCPPVVVNYKQILSDQVGQQMA